MFQVHENYDNFFDRLLKDGHVILKRNFVQEHGLMDRITEFCYEVFSHHISSQKLETLKATGFEKMHEVLTHQEVHDANAEMCPTCKDIFCELTRKFVTETLGEPQFWLDNRPIARFYTPYDYFAEEHDLMDSRWGALRLQGPHHDTWFGHAITGVNIWVAVGRVLEGNGLSVYPDMWGKYVPHDGKQLMPKDQYLGQPVNFHLEPGDALFFPGELVHASELNITDETRFVITSRFSMEEPEFKYGSNNPWVKIG